MPTYQYACTACGERLEAVQSFTDAPLTECAVCGGALRKVFSAVGVVFKGSGFYKTDSRAKSGGGSSESKGSGDTSSTSGGSGSSDKGGATPAATPAAASSSSSSGSSSSGSSSSGSKTGSTPASKTA